MVLPEGVTGDVGWVVTLKSDAFVPDIVTLLGLPVKVKFAAPKFSVE